MLNTGMLNQRMFRTLDEAPIGLDNLYRGKVRDCYDLPGDQYRIIIATDRLSAFDRPICSIPFKGQVLTQTARYWFERTAKAVPNHVVRFPDPNIMIVKKLNIIPVEIVIRDYLAGTTSTSILKMYQNGERKPYGVELPDGLQPNQKLPETIITPTTKAEDHDLPLTPDEIIERGLLTEAQWQTVKTYAFYLFDHGSRAAAKRNLILVDSKYEFGFDKDGNILLADEIHTPDSSRYWDRISYAHKFITGQQPDSWDKDVIRRWIVGQCNPYEDEIPEIPPELIARTAMTYISAYEMITGQKFEPRDVEPSILDNLCANLFDASNWVANLSQ